MDPHRLEDAARMAAAADLPVTITLTDRGFRVQAFGPFKSNSRIVPYDEVDLANHNCLATAVHQVVKAAS